jgi:hypothetical protein
MTVTCCCGARLELSTDVLTDSVIANEHARFLAAHAPCRAAWASKQRRAMRETASQAQPVGAPEATDNPMLVTT